MRHGINRHMFGRHDPVQAGAVARADFDEALHSLAAERGVAVQSAQANSAGAMCERHHRAFEESEDTVRINAGGWTHDSQGIRAPWPS